MSVLLTVPWLTTLYTPKFPILGATERWYVVPSKGPFAQFKKY